MHVLAPQLVSNLGAPGLHLAVTQDQLGERHLPYSSHPESKRKGPKKQFASLGLQTRARIQRPRPRRGDMPSSTPIYHLWEAFNTKSKVGGACGEIVALKGKNAHQPARSRTGF